MSLAELRDTEDYSLLGRDALANSLVWLICHRYTTDTGNYFLSLSLSISKKGDLYILTPPQITILCYLGLKFV
jgi:hypothetical protein